MAIPAFTAGRIYQLCASGASRRKAASQMKVSPTTVNNIMTKTEDYDGSKKRTRSTRDSVAERRKALCRLARRNLTRRTADGIVNIGRAYPTCDALAMALVKKGYANATARSVQKDLRAAGYALRSRPRVVANTPLLNAKRLAFAKRMLRKPWRNIRFSDEAWVNDNDNTHRREWVDLSARHLTRPTPKVYQRRPRIKLMVWGCIGMDYKSELIMLRRSVKAKVYVEDVLQKARAGITRGVFMHDNARPHTAKFTRAWLKLNGVRLLEGWPAHSPHLNPIEHLWALIHKAIAKRRPRSIKQLEKIARQVWDEFPQSKINKLVAGFGADLKKTVQLNGEPW